MENLKKMSIQEIREEAEKDYPFMSSEELKTVGLEPTLIGTNGSIWFSTDCGSKIRVCMEPGKEYGAVRINNSADRGRFSDEFLKSTAMRVLMSAIPASFPSIYYYTKYIYPLKQKTENKRSSDNSR